MAQVLCHTCCSYPCHATLRRFLRPTRCRLRFVARLYRDGSQPVLSQHSHDWKVNRESQQGRVLRAYRTRTSGVLHTIGTALSPLLALNALLWLTDYFHGSPRGAIPGASRWQPFGLAKPTGPCQTTSVLHMKHARPAKPVDSVARATGGRTE